MTLEQQIEAVLFYKAEPVKRTDLADFLNIDEPTLQAGIDTLNEKLRDRVTHIVQTDTSLQLVLNEECGGMIETLRKEDLKRDIGKAGAETLAIVLYRGPISRAEIDKIRGVNSTFILRNLLMRGLVERRDNPRDQRSYLYAITPNLLNHLGIKAREELPDFAGIMNSLDTYEKEQAKIESETSPFG